MSKKKQPNKNTASQKEQKLDVPPNKKVVNEAQSKSFNPFWTNHKMHLILIFLVSCALYVNTLGHQYAVDDSIVILRNQFTKKGFAGMKGIWTEDTFTGFFGTSRNLVAGGRYRPLSLATFAVELQLFGTPIADKDGKPILDADGDINYNGSPFISHFFNLLLYAWLCMVVYLVLLQLFNPSRAQDNLKGYFIAFAGALLYSTHPIHTEAVANIKGRDEILVLLGALLALYWVLKAAVEENKNKAIAYHLAAVLAFVVGIFSKENAVTFLVIIPAALYFFTKLPIKQIVISTIPYFVITLVFWFGIRGQILGDASSVVGAGSAPAMELMNDPFLKIENNRYVPFSSEEWLATVLYTWLEYLKLLVYPHPLTNDYYPKHIRTDLDLIPTFKMGKVVLSIFIHLALAGLLAIGTLKRKPYAFFILFYFATFSVVSNLVFPIGSNMAERFMFLPSVGFSALCAMGLYALVSRAYQQGKGLAQALLVPSFILIVISAAYSIRTVLRNPAWYNDFVLFTTDIHNSPHSAKLNNAVSGVLQDSANRAPNLLIRKELVEQALKNSITATNLHPTYNGAWLLRGNANTTLGILAEAQGATATDPQTQRDIYIKSLEYYNSGIEAYLEVQRLRPDHPDVKQNMGVVYRDRGKLLGQRLGNVNESIASIEKSLTFSIKDFESFRLLGVAYGIRGIQFQQSNRLEDATASHYTAISYFEKALEMNPNSVAILFNLEVAYRQLGNEQKFMEMNAKWKEIDPNYDPSKQE